MTPDELRQAGEAIYGPRWQTNMARDLKVSPRTVRQWAKGDRAVSNMAAAFIDRLAKDKLE